MPAQRANIEMVDFLSAFFQRRTEPNFALANAVSTYLALPYLRLFVPFSSRDENGHAFDLSGQGRTLTNNGSATYNVAGLAPYAEMNGTTQFFSRADEAGLDITGGLTLGGWFKFLTLDATIRGIMTKDNGAAQRSYSLYYSPTGKLSFQVDRLGDGTSVSSVQTTIAPSTGVWYNVVGKFYPGNEILIVLNGEQDINSVGVVASAFNSTTAFEIGRINLNNANCLHMDACFCWVCAGIVPNRVIVNQYQMTRGLFYKA